MALQPSQKKRLTLWLAVSGTMAVIVTLWVLQLPNQMRRMAEQAGSPVSRWMDEKYPTEDDPKSLQEVISDQRDLIDMLEEQQNADFTASQNANVPTPTEPPPQSE